jgi:hypothetical protein
MADIQTALSRVLDEWEGKADNAAPQPEATQPVKKNLFQPTNNVTRTTFEFVKANPGITRAEVNKFMAMRGFNEGSVASLITQFVRQNYMEIVDNKLFALVNDYVPLKDSRKIREEELKKAKTAKRKAAAEARAAKAKATTTDHAGIAALKNPEPLAQVTQRSAIITTNFSVENVIKNLTIYQAKELRDALNNLFK